MNIPDIISDDLKNLRLIFNKNGFDIRLVGGVVRDMIAGGNPTDIDLCTDANPYQQIALYDANNVQYIATGLSHGTITVVLNHVAYEITSLRTDSDQDGRHATVSYTKDWLGDLSRRDFCFNAMSMTFDGQLIDPFNGKHDLENGIVRFVGNPDDRIKEDYLRIMRWFRFLGRYGDIAHPNNYDTIAAIARNAKGLNIISAERIWKEFKQILAHNSVNDILPLFRPAMVIGPIFQQLPYTRRAYATEYVNNVIARTTNPITRLIAFYSIHRNMVREYSKRFKWSKDETKLAEFLANNHSANWDHGRMMAVEGYPREFVKELAVLDNRDVFHTEVCNTWEVPVCPVNGVDIMDKFNILGQEVGIKLAEAKNFWADNNYNVNKEEIFKFLQTKV
jgi:poly(A) polymerase